MKRSLSAASFLIIVTLSLAPAALAKGQPHHVTITGPALSVPIVIASPQTWSGLDPWKVDLMDHTRLAMRERPQVGQWYRVAYYVTDHNNLGYQSLFAAYYYYADPYGGPGYVYWQGWTNDPLSNKPKWYYASAEWGVRMQGLLNEHASAAASSNLTQRIPWLAALAVIPFAGAATARLLRRRRQALAESSS